MLAIRLITPALCAPALRPAAALPRLGWAAALHTGVGRRQAAAAWEAPARPSVIDLVLGDHAVIAEDYNTFKATRDPEERRTVLDQFVRDVLTHHAAEEAIFYPNLMARRTDRYDTADLRDEHREVKWLLRDLKVAVDGGADEAEVEERLESVWSAVSDHNLKEERRELPAMLNQYSESDLADLGAFYIAAREGSPHYRK